MKKLILFLLVCSLFSVSVWADVNVTIISPGSGGIFTSSLTLINATTNITANCTYNISDGTNSIANILTGDGALVHTANTIDISSLNDGANNVTILCFNNTDITETGNDTVTITKDTSPPIVYWVDPLNNTNVTPNQNLTITIEGYHSNFGITDQNFIISCNYSSNGTLFGVADAEGAAPGQNDTINQTWLAPDVLGAVFCNITANVTAGNDPVLNTLSTITVNLTNTQTITIVEFLNEVDDGNSTRLNLADEESVNTLELFANVTNTSAAAVNITHGGICIGAPDPLPMTFSAGDFLENCTINTSLLSEALAGNLLNVTAYLLSYPSVTDESNFTIYADFTRPVIQFGEWWDTVNESGGAIKFANFSNLIGQADIFYSPNETTITFQINVTDNDGVDSVEANFSSGFTTFMANTSGNCSGVINLTQAGNYWVGSCDLGDFDDIETYNFDTYGSEDPVLGFDITFTAYDDSDNPSAQTYNSSVAGVQACDVQGPPPDECMPVLTPILIHTIGVMGPDEEDFEEDDSCLNYGSATTNFNEITDFADVDFTIDMEVNMTCIYNFWNHTGTLPAESGFERMMMMNFSGLDFNNQETAFKLAMLADNIDVELNFPGEFGESYIYLNSSYFAELNETATIAFYHLPFKSEPAIVEGVGAAGVTGSTTWTSFSDPFWNGATAGNLTFTVLGFSNYNITDNVTPEVTINAPAQGATTSTLPTVNVTLNGTGTQISAAYFYIDGTMVANYTNSTNTANCVNQSLGSEMFDCVFTVSSALAGGTRNLTVTAFDYGDSSPGNNNSGSVTFNVDATAPTVTLVNSSFNTTDTTPNIYFNFTDAGSTTANCSLYFNGTSKGNNASVSNATETMITASALSGDGIYAVTVNCTDTFDNEGVSNSIDVLLDTGGPTVSATIPTASTWYKDNITVTATATDVSGVDQVQYRVLNSTGSVVQAWTNMTLSAGSYTATFDITTLSDAANYTFAFNATDSLGQSNASVNVTGVHLDDTSPVNVSVSCNDITAGDGRDCTCSADDNSESFGGSISYSYSGDSPSTAGTTTVTCTATDSAGNTNTSTDSYTVTAASGGGGGATGSSGGVTAAAPGSFAKEIWVSINAGETGRVEVENGELGVTDVEFDVLETVWGAWLQVAKKTSLPSNVGAFGRKVYRYIEITKGVSLKDNLISKAMIKFKVSKIWLSDNGLSGAGIALFRYVNGQWVELTTTTLNEDSEYIYFSADTPGFSYFVIGAKTGAKALAEEAAVGEEIPTEATGGETPAEGVPEAGAEATTTGEGVEEKANLLWLWIVLALVVVALIVGLVIWSRKRK